MNFYGQMLAMFSSISRENVDKAFNLWNKPRVNQSELMYYNFVWPGLKSIKFHAT